MAKKIYKLIIEGQQFVGKTTIANNLARRYLPAENPFLFKLSGPTSDNKEIKKYMENVLLDYAGLFRHITKNSIIVDRFHISEQVYGKFYRGYEHDPEFIESVEDLLDQQGFRLLYMYMDKSVIPSRINLKSYEFNIDEDKLVSYEKQIKIRKLYDKYVRKSKLKVIKVDVTDIGVLDTIKIINKKLTS